MSEPMFTAGDVQTLAAGMTMLGDRRAEAQAALSQAVEAYDEGIDPSAIARELQIRFGQGTADVFIQHWLTDEQDFQPEPEPPTAIEYILSQAAGEHARREALRLEAELAAQQAAQQAAEASSRMQAAEVEKLVAQHPNIVNYAPEMAQILAGAATPESPEAAREMLAGAFRASRALKEAEVKADMMLELRADADMWEDQFMPEGGTPRPRKTRDQLIAENIDLREIMPPVSLAEQARAALEDTPHEQAVKQGWNVELPDRPVRDLMRENQARHIAEDIKTAYAPDDLSAWELPGDEAA